MLKVVEIAPVLAGEGAFIAELRPEDEDCIVQCHKLDKPTGKGLVLSSLNLLFFKQLVVPPESDKPYPLKATDLVTLDEQWPQLFRPKNRVTAVRSSGEGVINWVFSRNLVYAEIYAYPQI